MCHDHRFLDLYEHGLHELQHDLIDRICISAFSDQRISEFDQTVHNDPDLIISESDPDFSSHRAPPLSYPSLLFSFSINVQMPHCKSAIPVMLRMIAGSILRHYDIHTAKAGEAGRRLRSGSRTREPMILFASGETRRRL